MGINYLGRRHLTERVPAGSVKLTVVGLDALDGYRARAAHVQDRALQAALLAIVSQRHTLAAGLVPPAGCWRGVRARTWRRPSAFWLTPGQPCPWQPMVLPPRRMA